MSLFYGFSVGRGGQSVVAGHCPAPSSYSRGRLRLPGLCPALRPLRGSGVHHPQGDELPPSGPCAPSYGNWARRTSDRSWSTKSAA